MMFIKETPLKETLEEPIQSEKAVVMDIAKAPALEAPSENKAGNTESAYSR